MESTWWYADNNEKKGPVLESDLLILRRRGEVTDATLVWKEGMEQWEAFGDVLTLTPPPLNPPDLPVQGTSPEPVSVESVAEEPEASKPEVEEFSPSAAEAAPTSTPTLKPAKAWHRYFARMIDISLLAIPVAIPAGMALGYYAPDFGSGVLDGPGGDWVLNIFILPIVLLVEALILVAFGTTPGKKLLKITVTNLNGGRLTFGGAARRKARMFFSGLGIGFPLIGLFTMVWQKSRVDQGQKASYDEGLCVVNQGEISNGRAWAGGLLAIGLIIGTAAFSAIADIWASKQPSGGGSQSASEVTVNEILIFAAKQTNKNLPERLDEITILERVVPGNHLMEYQYTVEGYTAGTISQAQIEDVLRPDLVKNYCNSEELDWYREEQVPLKYTYMGEDGVILGAFKVSLQDCFL